MNKRIFITGGVIAILALALIALPSHSAAQQDPQDEAVRAKTLALQARLASLRARVPAMQELQSQEVEPLEIDVDNEPLVIGDSGGSWLGVETHEVTSDSVKSLKLPAERGAVIGK